MKYSFLLGLALALSACSPEQSKSIGSQPKKTVDKVTVDVNGDLLDEAKAFVDKI